MSLTTNIEIGGGFTQTEGTTSVLTAAARLGQNGNLNGLLQFEEGTGNGQINQIFVPNPFTINANTTLTYDLKGSGGELDVLNRSLAMTAVKLVIVRLNTAEDGVHFGPQNVANAAQLWFNGVTSDFFDSILQLMMQGDMVDGWVVNNTNKKLVLYNPHSTNAVSGQIWVYGTK